MALTHDVLLTVGIFSLLQLEFDLSIVAALLTILGYSVNDTVVVSDRIRENLRKYKRMELDELLNLSINETLSRTILTGCTAIVVLVALYIFGGEVIRNFNFAMLFGVVIGTYSSIFIAAPLLGYLGVKREWGGGPAAKPSPKRRRRPTSRSGAGANVALQMTHGIGALSRAGADRCLRQRRLPLRRHEPPRLDPVPAERHLRLARPSAGPRSTRGRSRRCSPRRRAGRAAARHRPRARMCRRPTLRRAFTRRRHRARRRWTRVPPAAPTTCCSARAGPSARR